jgi:integrase
MRQPKPFYRSQTKTWYVQIGKKQHNLGPDEAAAKRKYYALMADRQDATDSSQVIAVLRKFLAWNKAHRSAGTQTFYSRPILSFAEHIGETLTVDKLKNHHVTEWVDKVYGKLGPNSRRNAIRGIQRAFNWAVDEGHLTASPIKKYKKPAPRSRETILEAGQWEAIVAHLQAESGEEFLDFATILRQTGCRPQEARLIEARHLDRKKRCLTFESEESKGDNDERAADRRVVPLSDSAFAICAKLAIRYPEGPILRNEDSNAWTTRAIGKRFERLSRKLKFEPAVSAYVLRHTFATEALENGVDPVTVATIMGHKDLTQLMKTYQHLKKKGEYLRKAVEQAIGATQQPVSLSA